MTIFDSTTNYMLFNVKLALLGVIFGWIMYKVHNKLVQWIFFILWLLFVPNTIYLFTDIVNFYRDSQGLNSFGVAILILQYAILLTIGLFSFVTAMYPFEYLLRLHFRGKKRIYSPYIIIALNLLIGFAMVLGRVLRVNSWDVFTYPNFVLWAIEQVFISGDLFGLTILFGLFATFLYYVFKKQIFAALYLLLRKRRVY